MQTHMQMSKWSYFFSQPLNSVWHNWSTRHTCPKLAASMLQTETVPGLELPLYHSCWAPPPPSCCSCPCPSPHFPTLRQRPITRAFLSPDTPEHSWPSQPSNRVNPHLSIYLHLCLPSPGVFLASGDQQLPFSWPHLSNESPSPLPSFTKWQQKWNIPL